MKVNKFNNFNCIKTNIFNNDKYLLYDTYMFYLSLDCPEHLNDLNNII